MHKTDRDVALLNAKESADTNPYGFNLSLIVERHLGDVPDALVALIVDIHAVQLRCKPQVLSILRYVLNIRRGARWACAAGAAPPLPSCGAPVV